MSNCKNENLYDTIPNNEIQRLMKNHYKIIDAIRRLGKRANKTKLTELLGVSRPTTDSDLNKIVALIDQSDSESISLNRHIGFFLGIAVGTNEIKAIILNFNLDSYTISDYQDKGLTLLFAIKGIIPCDLLKSQGNDFDNDDKKDCMLCFKTPSDEYTLMYIINEIINVCINPSFENDKKGKKPPRLLGVGMAFPGAIDYKRGIIVKSPNLSYLNGLPIYDMLLYSTTKDALVNNGVCFNIEHNAKAICICEKEDLYKSNSLYKNKSNIGVVYFGTGVGLGLILRGSLFRGSNNFSGELGHIPVPNYIVENNIITVAAYEEDNLCSCGKNNCLELLIQKNVFDALDIKSLKSKIQDDRLKTLDPAKIMLLRHYMGYISSILINLFNLDLIVFSGKIFDMIPNIKSELPMIGLSSGLDFSRKGCNVITGQNKAFSVAKGAAMCSYFKLCEIDDIFWPQILHND